MIQDSGQRREFATGAVRDIQEGKGRCDLLPLDVVADLIPRTVLKAINRFKKIGNPQALGMTEAQLMAQTNARGSWERMFSLGKEPVRIVCVREKQEKRERPVKMKIKLAERPPDGKCTFPGLAAMMVEV